MSASSAAVSSGACSVAGLPAPLPFSAAICAAVLRPLVLVPWLVGGGGGSIFLPCAFLPLPLVSALAFLSAASLSAASFSALALASAAFLSVAFLAAAVSFSLVAAFLPSIK